MSTIIPSASMSVAAAAEYLDTLVREELRDHAFGDAELEWYELVDGQKIYRAWGYLGQRSSVGIQDPADPNKSLCSWEGADARMLAKHGRQGDIARNDTTGPDQFVQGQIMPGLTLEGVRKEICTPPAPTESVDDKFDDDEFECEHYGARD